MCVSQHGYTPLSQAAQDGKAAFVSMLINKVPDIDLDYSAEVEFNINGYHFENAANIAERRMVDSTDASMQEWPFACCKLAATPRCFSE